MISVITCTRTPARLAALRENLRQRLGAEPHEFVAIEDARSLAEGYNRAVKQSRGDVIIACHDDIEILAEDFTARLLVHLRTYDLLGVAGSTRMAGPRWAAAGPPHVFGQVVVINAEKNGYNVCIWGVPARCVGGIQVMDGLFLAGRREVFTSVGFDEATFKGFHLYDVDFTYRAARAGHRLAVCNDFDIIHASRGNFDDRWQEDARRFLLKHGAELHVGSRHVWNTMVVKVPTKEGLREVLRPLYWAE